jgi:hypothetical protein
LGLDPTIPPDATLGSSLRGKDRLREGSRDIAPRYPACPHWQKVWDAWKRFHASLLKQFQESGEDPATYLDDHYRDSPDRAYYYDLQAGRKCQGDEP